MNKSIESIKIGISIYHANVNVNLMIKTVIQMKSGIMINDNSANVKIQKDIVCAKNIIFGILLHVAVKVVNI